MSSTLRNLALAALSVLAAACASDATSKVCPTTGIVCPEDTICAAAQPVCLVSSCGNGQLDPGEQCDDGNIIDGDRCSSLCRNEICGNGILDVGEACDPPPGNTTGGDGCSEICTIESCGNGRRDFGEECDDGNLENGDGCTGTPIEISDGAGGTQRSPEPCKSTEVCGNGVKDFQVGEVCDDGNTISGDGCNSDCRSGEGCGNGILDPGEECDDGNSDDHDRCHNSCKLSVCGDGVIESTTSPGVPPRETCDPGDPNNIGAIETVDCNIDCTVATCGDRKVNTTKGEECDNGAGANTENNNCTDTCLVNVCGDGKKDTQIPNQEACDDGNTNNFDGCSNSCQLNTCGNSQVDSGEECDDGNTNSNDLCVSCKNAKCGDGWIQSGVEECDGDGAGTGDTVSGDGCSNSCRVERCGNMIIDPGETCDDGQTPVVDPPSTTASPGPTAPENADACVNALSVAQCQNARCGDGYKRDTEQCDDGNNTNGDGCSASCINEGCGNGVLETVRGEQCDDNNVMGGDGCSATCQLEDCGDGVVDVGEECDGTGMPGVPGVGGETATCNADCTMRSCGDGKINNAANEQCDDGTIGGINQNQNSRDCRADCRLNFCTDGFQNTAGTPSKREACDDGNMINNDECSNSCQSAQCGNGLLDTNEECDLGGSNSDTGACTLSCKISTCGDGKVRTGVEECDPGDAGFSADGPCLPGVGAAHIGGCRFARCGDGDLQTQAVPPGNVGTFAEACDNGEENGVTACQYGANSCQVCTTGCTLSAGTTARCGDGIANGTASHPEACDRGALNGVTECTYGQTAGACELCSSSCTALADRLHVCGDGVVDNGQSWGGSEVCDDGDTTTETQLDCTGYNTSCLFCNATCGATVSFTGPHCGDGTCDAGNENNTNCPIDCTSRCGNGIRENNEQCDNDSVAVGNTPAAGDGCSATCTVEFGFTCAGAQGVQSSCSTSCGDGKKASTEACDDGNTSSGDGCTNLCATEAGFTCTTQAGSFTVCTRNTTCGDGFVTGAEMCDNIGHNNGTDCIATDSPPAYGAGNACVSCSASCMMVVSSDFCGDASINGSEQCDSNMLGGAVCSTAGGGFDAGTLACNNTTCTFDTSMCTDCGNGIRETGEACDNGGGAGDGCDLACTVEPGFFCTGNVGSASTCSAFATCATLTTTNGAVGSTCNDNTFYDRGDGVEIACPCATAGGFANNTCTGDNATTEGSCTCVPDCTGAMTGDSDKCGGMCP